MATLKSKNVSKCNQGPLTCASCIIHLCILAPQPTRPQCVRLCLIWFKGCEAVEAVVLQHRRDTKEMENVLCFYECVCKCVCLRMSELVHASAAHTRVHVEGSGVWMMRLYICWSAPIGCGRIARLRFWASWTSELLAGISMFLDCTYYGQLHI